MRPFLLNSFAMHPPNTLHEVEGILRLTGSTVTGKMEFWDQVGELELINVQVRVVLGETIEMMDQPFTGNVVRNHNIVNGDTLQYRCNDVVHIYVPRQLSEPLH